MSLPAPHPRSLAPSCTAEEFNQTLKLQEAANITRLRALLLQNAAIVAQLQAAKDSNELLCRMRAQKKLMATMVNDDKAEEACEIVQDLAEQQQLQDSIKDILTMHPDSHQELLECVIRRLAQTHRSSPAPSPLHFNKTPALQRSGAKGGGARGGGL